MFDFIAKLQQELADMKLKHKQEIKETMEEKNAIFGWQNVTHYYNYNIL